MQPFLKIIGNGQRTARDLTPSEAEAAIRLILDREASPAQVGAFIAAQLTAAATWGSLYSGVSRGVMPFDLGLFLLKGVGLGTVVGWLCCHYGLQVKSSPTEVPQQASRAVVMSLLCGVVYSTFVTALFYWLVGPPIQ